MWTETKASAGMCCVAVEDALVRVIVFLWTTVRSFEHCLLRLREAEAAHSISTGGVAITSCRSHDVCIGYICT